MLTGLFGGAEEGFVLYIVSTDGGFGFICRLVCYSLLPYFFNEEIRCNVLDVLLLYLLITWGNLLVAGRHECVGSAAGRASSSEG